MNAPKLLVILKLLVMLIFFLIVVIIGTLPIRSKNFKRRPLLRTIGATFAGALFINVSIMHILPESADTLEEYLRKKQHQDEVFPLAYLLLMVGFLITVFFTKVLSFHSHEEDHEEEVNENTSSSTEEDDQKKDQPEIIAEGKDEQKMKASLIESQRQSHNHDHHGHNHEHGHGHHLENKSMLNEAYILTIAIYFHTIFEGIAIGVQNTTTGFLSTAVAIAFHKWADALSMGCHYRTKNVKKQVAYGLIIGQALLNVLSIGAGWLIASQGTVVEAIFLSISAGTFLAISTLEMLGEQLHQKQFMGLKFGLMVFATGFVASIWFLENSIFG